MKTSYSLLVKLMLIGLLFSAGAIGSASAVSNLSISKSGVITAPENITWTIKVTNYNDTAFSVVNVTDNIPMNCSVVGNSTTNGTYKDGHWSFSLDSALGENEILTLNMTCDVNLACNTSLKIENNASITYPLDVPAGNKTVRANVTLKGGVCLPVTVKPETLNIKKVGIQANGKGGVITVFITVGDAFNKTDILGDSFITCNDADAKILFSEKDNGTIIAKFRRGDLNVTADGEITKISCYGEINTTAGKYIIEGNDTVRAIHADNSGKQTSLLDRILRFLGIQPSEGEDEISTDVISPDSLEGIKNLGQFNKQIHETPTVTPEGEEEDNKISPTPTDIGKGKSKDLEIETTPTPGRENGKGKGQEKPNDNNGRNGKD